MGDLVFLRTTTTQDIPPERVIAGAGEVEFKSLVIVGELAVGGLYFASSAGNPALTNWLLSQAQFQLLAERDDGERST